MGSSRVLSDVLSDLLDKVPEPENYAVLKERLRKSRSSREAPRVKESPENRPPADSSLLEE